MKKRLAWLLGLCLLFGMAGCAGDGKIGADAAASAGGVGNPSFEDGFGFWSRRGGGIDLEEGAAADGSRCLLLGSGEDYEADVRQHITGLAPGYYYLEVSALNEGNQDFCYVYGRGSSQDRCMTAVPVTSSGGWKVTTVRGIRVEEDGALEIGFAAKGAGQSARFDDVKLLREKNQQRAYPSLFGGAVSWLDWEEDSGASYFDENRQEKDALRILRENGCNFVRLELYNHPGDYVSAEGDSFPAGYKDADAIFSLAERAHAQGFEIQLSFMYADYWGNEAIPSDWLAGMAALGSDAEKAAFLTDEIYRYTYGFMKRLRDAGIVLAYVSIGNEIDDGILLPYGSSSAGEDSAAALAGFLNSGYRAVKDVSPESRVVLHIAGNADDMHWKDRRGAGRWFFDLMEKYGVPYDVIGTSYYPFWAQNDSAYAVKKALDLDDLKAWAEMMTDTYDRDILIMESGYNWGAPGQLADNGAYRDIYPSTPEGQRDFVIDLLNTVKSVKDGRCVGSLYWDPVLVRQEGVGYAVTSDGQARPNVVETTAFFDYDHVALPVLKAYRYN